MSHYIDQNKIVFNNNLVIQDGKQSNDCILVSDDDGLVRWDSKTNYISNKEFDHYIGEWFGGGVVVAVWKENNQEKCLVVAPQDCSFSGIDRFSDTGFPPYINTPFLGFTVPWSNVVNQTSGASWSVSGASNSNIIVSQSGFSTTINPFINEENNTVSGYSGAAQYALNYINPDLGSGIFNDWYLPAAHEILTLWNNAAIVNKVLYEYSQYNNIPLTSNSTTTNTNINIFGMNGSGQALGYWTSTEASATEAYYLSTNGSLMKDSKNTALFSSNVSGYKQVRPFRVASDNQVSFNFDAEYLIITYRYFDGKDLDSYTRMIAPTQSSVPSITPWSERSNYVNGVNGGPYASNYVGFRAKRPWAPTTTDYVFDFTPGATTSLSPTTGYTATIPNPSDNSTPSFVGNNSAGTYSILIWAGDNTGPNDTPPSYEQSYETVLVNLQAFKFHYPGQSTIRLECFGNWYTAKGTTPVRVKVDMYKGGLPVVNGPVFNNKYIWENPTATSNLSLDAIDKVVTTGTNTQTTGIVVDKYVDATRVAIVEYNINTKIGKIIAG